MDKIKWPILYRNALAGIIWLETDPDGQNEMLLIRDEKDNIIQGISFENEIDEIIDFILSLTQQAEEKWYTRCHIDITWVDPKDQY